MNVETANRLQKLRKQNGYSQEELAEKIGISRQAVSKWERAEASPDTDNLILLSKLYGVTLDELLRTESVPMPDSEGISLRKEDYENPQPRDDDGEIYPERKNPYSYNYQADNNEKASSENEKQARGNNAEAAAGSEKQANTSSAGTDPAEFIKTVAGFTADVTRQAIDTAAKAFSEADEKIKNGAGMDKAMEESFQRNFSGFGSKVKSSADTVEKAAESFGETVARKFGNTAENFGETVARNFESAAADRNFDSTENIRSFVEDVPKHGQSDREKYPATLLDKLFPLIVTGLFFILGSRGMWHPAWLVFFMIPIYYIFSDSGKRRKSGKLTFGQSVVRFVDGALPVAVTFIFLACVTAHEANYRYFPIFYETFWTIFLIIPLYYTAKAAIKKRDLIYFCYPVLAAWAFFIWGALFSWTFAIAFLATIPFYYIIVDHFRKKNK